VDTSAALIEVWLRQDDDEIICTVVSDDESTYELDVDALSMRGAQREMTGYFIDQSYEPADQWQVEVDGADGPVETVRRFRPTRFQGQASNDDVAGDALDAAEFTADELLP
ncbi:Mycobacterium terramassiliense ORFan, partial [Mycobacterium terramassiliense]